MPRRLPIESTQPVLLLAAVRLGLSVGSLILTVALGFPYGGQLALVLAVVAVPWAVGLLVLAVRLPEAGFHPLVAAGDVVVLVIVELVVPETFGAVRVVALFFFAVHAHFQGEARGVAIAAGGVAALVLATALRGGTPVSGDLLAFYEAAFAVASLGVALIVGRLRTAESASRLRARDLTRRTIEAEREIRRRVAESLHDGPVQELIGLDMILAAARQAAERGEAQRLDALIADARELLSRNVQSLRDEIFDLGPYAFSELTYELAVQNCVPVWERRYGLELRLQLERLDLSPGVAGDLFSITQEAVVNAGRHAHADSVTIDLRSYAGFLELRVMDDGEGFGSVDPLGASEPGHVGLASIRERAELLDGKLTIESSGRGTKVLVRAPLPGSRSRSDDRRPHRASVREARAS
jgi:signal transduction histidine kinase